MNHTQWEFNSRGHFNKSIRTKWDHVTKRWPARTNQSIFLYNSISMCDFWMTVFSDVIWALIWRYHSRKHDLICCLNSTHCPHLRQKHSLGWLAYPKVWGKVQHCPTHPQLPCAPWMPFHTEAVLTHQANLKSKNLNVLYTGLTKGELPFRLCFHDCNSSSEIYLCNPVEAMCVWGKIMTDVTDSPSCWAWVTRGEAPNLDLLA